VLLLSDPELRDIYAQNARKLARQYSVDKIAAAWEQLQ